MFFIRLNVEIDWPGKRPPYVPHAKYAHAAIMQAITSADEPLGQQLHDMRRDKPISLAFFNNFLQVSLVGKEALRYMQALLTYWQTNPTLNLQGQDYKITGIDLNANGEGQVRTWRDLTVPSQHKLLYFSYLTPTALTRQDSQRHRYTILNPEPLHIFSALAERWHRLGGCSLPDGLKNYLADGGCVIQKYKLRTVAFPVEDRQQIGFLGDVTYLCRQMDASYIESLNWLTRLAPFVGIGYQTARGMGAVSTRFSR